MLFEVCRLKIVSVARPAVRRPDQRTVLHMTRTGLDVAQTGARRGLATRLPALVAGVVHLVLLTSRAGSSSTTMQADVTAAASIRSGACDLARPRKPVDDAQRRFLDRRVGRGWRCRGCGVRLFGPDSLGDRRRRHDRSRTHRRPARRTGRRGPRSTVPVTSCEARCPGVDDTEGRGRGVPWSRMCGVTWDARPVGISQSPEGAAAARRRRGGGITDLHPAASSGY